MRQYRFGLINVDAVKSFCCSLNKVFTKKANWRGAPLLDSRQLKIEFGQKGIGAKHLNNQEKKNNHSIFIKNDEKTEKQKNDKREHAKRTAHYLKKCTMECEFHLYKKWMNDRHIDISLKVSKRKWRISNVNAGKKLCTFLPELIVVPFFWKDVMITRWIEQQRWRFGCFGGMSQEKRCITEHSKTENVTIQESEQAPTSASSGSHIMNPLSLKTTSNADTSATSSDALTEKSTVDSSSQRDFFEELVGLKGLFELVAGTANSGLKFMGAGQEKSGNGARRNQKKCEILNHNKQDNEEPPMIMPVVNFIDNNGCTICVGYWSGMICEESKRAEGFSHPSSRQRSRNESDYERDDETLITRILFGNKENAGENGEKKSSDFKTDNNGFDSTEIDDDEHVADTEKQRRMDYSINKERMLSCAEREAKLKCDREDRNLSLQEQINARAARGRRRRGKKADESKEKEKHSKEEEEEERRREKERELQWIREKRRGEVSLWMLRFGERTQKNAFVVEKTFERDSSDEKLETNGELESDNDDTNESSGDEEEESNKEKNESRNNRNKEDEGHHIIDEITHLAKYERRETRKRKESIDELFSENEDERGEWSEENDESDVVSLSDDSMDEEANGFDVVKMDGEEEEQLEFEKRKEERIRWQEEREKICREKERRMDDLEWEYEQMFEGNVEEDDFLVQNNDFMYNFSLEVENNIIEEEEIEEEEIEEEKHLNEGGEHFVSNCELSNDALRDKENKEIVWKEELNGIKQLENKARATVIASNVINDEVSWDVHCTLKDEEVQIRSNWGEMIMEKGIREREEKKRLEEKKKRREKILRGERQSTGVVAPYAERAEGTVIKALERNTGTNGGNIEYLIENDWDKRNMVQIKPFNFQDTAKFGGAYSGNIQEYEEEGNFSNNSDEGSDGDEDASDQSEHDGIESEESEIEREIMRYEENRTGEGSKEEWHDLTKISQRIAGMLREAEEEGFRVAQGYASRLCKRDKTIGKIIGLSADEEMENIMDMACLTKMAKRRSEIIEEKRKEQEETEARNKAMKRSKEKAEFLEKEMLWGSNNVGHEEAITRSSEAMTILPLSHQASASASSQIKICGKELNACKKVRLFDLLNKEEKRRGFLKRRSGWNVFMIEGLLRNLGWKNNEQEIIRLNSRMQTFQTNKSTENTLPTADTNSTGFRGALSKIKAGHRDRSFTTISQIESEHNTNEKNTSTLDSASLGIQSQLPQKKYVNRSKSTSLSSLNELWQRVFAEEDMKVMTKGTGAEIDHIIARWKEKSEKGFSIGTVHAELYDHFAYGRFSDYSFGEYVLDRREEMEDKEKEERKQRKKMFWVDFADDDNAMAEKNGSGNDRDSKEAKQMENEGGRGGSKRWAVVGKDNYGYENHGEIEFFDESLSNSASDKGSFVKKKRKDFEKKKSHSSNNLKRKSNDKVNFKKIKKRNNFGSRKSVAIQRLSESLTRRSIYEKKGELDIRRGFGNWLKGTVMKKMEFPSVRSIVSTLRRVGVYVMGVESGVFTMPSELVLNNYISDATLDDVIPMGMPIGSFPRALRRLFSIETKILAAASDCAKEVERVSSEIMLRKGLTRDKQNREADTGNWTNKVESKERNNEEIEDNRRSEIQHESLASSFEEDEDSCHFEEDVVLSGAFRKQKDEEIETDNESNKLERTKTMLISSSSSNAITNKNDSDMSIWRNTYESFCVAGFSSLLFPAHFVSVMISLMQILLWRKARTIDGMRIIIQTEWCYRGHAKQKLEKNDAGSCVIEPKEHSYEIIEADEEESRKKVEEAKSSLAKEQSSSIKRTFDTETSSYKAIQKKESDSRENTKIVLTINSLRNPDEVPVNEEMFETSVIPCEHSIDSCFVLFIIFLDCLFEIISQNDDEFEYNVAFLLFLRRHLLSGRFCDFFSVSKVGGDINLNKSSIRQDSNSKGTIEKELNEKFKHKECADTSECCSCSCGGVSIWEEVERKRELFVNKNWKWRNFIQRNDEKDFNKSRQRSERDVPCDYYENKRKIDNSERLMEDKPETLKDESSNEDDEGIPSFLKEILDNERMIKKRMSEKDLKTTQYLKVDCDSEDEEELSLNVDTTSVHFWLDRFFPHGHGKTESGTGMITDLKYF
eukprot:MONOS_4391.1-p1 / transcript=MONOS_4391.1 / gene=MONOS_4391 / organism=Monocercomonoides_exilis_PA203 / gene_product=unspecified product / transcript_product=unspecified product / location=Mono_scaffold00116:99227-105697(-) / protein_length=2118 / sequence_SO=supercontig / SO=protein_coding / is_pseudo=false